MNIQFKTLRENNIVQKFGGREGDKQTQLANALEHLSKLIPNGLTNGNKATIKHVLSICFSIGTLEVRDNRNNNQEENWKELFNIAVDLNKNASTWFQVVFPKSAVDLGVMCYIKSKLGDAFLPNGNLDIAGFKDFLREMLGESATAVIDNIKASYLNNIKHENGAVKYNNYHSNGSELPPAGVYFSQQLSSQSVIVPISQPRPSLPVKDPLDVALDKNLAELIEPRKTVEHYNNAFKEIKTIERKLGKALGVDLNRLYIDSIYATIVRNSTPYQNISDFITFLNSLPNDLKSSLENTLYTSLITHPKSFIKFYHKLARFNEENLRQDVTNLRNELALQFIGDVKKVFNIFILLIDSDGMSDVNNLTLWGHIINQLELLNEAQNSEARLFQQRSAVQQLYSAIAQTLNVALVERYDAKMEYKKSPINQELSLYDILETYADLQRSVILSQSDTAKVFQVFWIGESTELYKHCATEVRENLGIVSQKVKSSKNFADFEALVKEMRWAHSAGTVRFLNDTDIAEKFNAIQSDFRTIISDHLKNFKAIIDKRSFFSSNISSKLGAIEQILQMLEIIKQEKPENQFLQKDERLNDIIGDAQQLVNDNLNLLRRDKSITESEATKLGELVGRSCNL